MKEYREQGERNRETQTKLDYFTETAMKLLDFNLKNLG